MVTKYTFILLFFFSFFLGPVYVFSQSTIVFKVEDEVNVKYQGQNDIIYSSPSASDAIQYAINLSIDKVTLSRGLYELEQPIKLKSGIHISGQGRGTELKPIGKCETALEMLGIKDIKMSFMAIASGNSNRSHTGIKIDNSKGCILENLLVFGFSAYGIHIDNNSSGITINRSDIVGNDISNVYFQNIYKNGETNKIQQCIFYWGGGGVLAKSSFNLEIESSIFHQINGIPLDIECNNFSFLKNRVFLGESLDAGLKISGLDFKIKYNVITWNRGDGIVIENSDGGIVRANSITDHGAPPEDDIFKSGVVIKNSKNIEISANAIWNWDDWTQGPMEYGVIEDSLCKGNRILNNNIHFYRKQGIQSNGIESIINNNVLDPGKDDAKPLKDFDVWRQNIQHFIKENLSIEHKQTSYTEDFIIKNKDNLYIVETSITSQKVYSSMRASEAIQWSIDNSCENGGSVTLQNATYVLEIPIEIKRNVWLRGQGTKTILTTSSANNETAVQMKNAHQAIISDLSIFGSNLTDTGLTLVGCVNSKVQDVSINSFRQFGISFLEDSNVPEGTWNGKATSSLMLIDHNMVSKSGITNIYKPGSGGYLGNAIPSMISRNFIYDGGIGINCAGICDNLVDNLVFRTKGEALVINANSILTTGNFTYQTGATAFLAYDGIVEKYHDTYDRLDNNNNKECHVTNNVFLEQKGNGLEISEQWGPIVDNQIYNTGSSEMHNYGIWLHEGSESYVISSNVLYNSENSPSLDFGILEDKTATKNLIIKNSIGGCRRTIIKSKGKSALVDGNLHIKHLDFTKLLEQPFYMRLIKDWSNEEVNEYSKSFFSFDLEKEIQTSQEQLLKN